MDDISTIAVSLPTNEEQIETMFRDDPGNCIREMTNALKTDANVSQKSYTFFQRTILDALKSDTEFAKQHGLSCLIFLNDFSGKIPEAYHDFLYNLAENHQDARVRAMVYALILDQKVSLKKELFTALFQKEIQRIQTSGDDGPLVHIARVIANFRLTDFALILRGGTRKIETAIEAGRQKPTPEGVAKRGSLESVVTHMRSALTSLGIEP